MQAILRILYILYCPLLVLIYWRNSMKSLEEIQDPFNQYQNQNIDQDKALA